MTGKGIIPAGGPGARLSPVAPRRWRDAVRLSAIQCHNRSLRVAAKRVAAIFPDEAPELRMFRSQFRALVTLLGVVAAPAASAGWVAETVPTANPVAEVRQVGDAVFIRAGQWLSVGACDDGLVCKARQAPPEREAAPGGFPGGTVAEADNDNSGVRSAWFAEPTDRYAHGALGDPIEAGALVVQDVRGRRITVRLGSDEVFEDLEPRIADLTDNGENEVLAIRSTLSAGASVAAYRLVGGTLAEIAATPPIGRPNRWLNVAGIADFTGDRRVDIALVETPHIGGRLEIYTLRGARLKRVDRMDGFSNHVFASTELGMSAVADVNGDPIEDLVLPDAQRHALRMVSAAGGKLQELANVPLDGAVATAIGVVTSSERPVFVLGLEDGRLAAVTFKEGE
jgi:hypothetical protein